MCFYLHVSLSSFPQVKACMDVFADEKRDCGNFSAPVFGMTLNGVPDRISDLLLECEHSVNKVPSTIKILWQPPKNPNGVIDHYKIEIVETASYINGDGQRRYYNNDYRQNVAGSLRNYTFYNALPNTNYTIKVSSKTENVLAQGRVYFV